jgi:acyl transferase domain-containing protein/acyl carrier protein
MNDKRNLLQESLATIQRLQARLAASESASREPIAIIGAGCRYPGDVQSPDDLWRVVRDGVDAVSEIPADRWDADAYYDPDPAVPNKMVTRRAGFLGQVDRFDSQFFGISPREAQTMDPQQRLLLETAHEALENAGLAIDQLAGSATGVFVGITTSDYARMLQAGGPENSDVYSATGGALNAAAGRISFTFGLQGPCVALDTACSSSLVATHLACKSLRSGESDLALAGGVNLILSPDAMILFSKWGMMAPDGACKSFDAGADGFVRAEGCAVIALKRLSDAMAAGDPILAVIRGSAVNSDGRSSGLTVPNGPAQEAVLRKALADAGLKAADIDYVEAHGTGTPLGDPIEVEALGAVMGVGRPAGSPLRVGSVKTNLGHTEAASGLAGLLKTAMALQHETLPPSLHFSHPNPRIDWERLAVEVQATSTAWARGDRPRRAGVSSFGFSGTNAHIILEEAPVRAQPPQPRSGPVVLPLSARSEDALRDLAARYADAVEASGADLHALAAAAGTGRSHMTRRAAVTGETADELAAALRAIAAGEASPDAVLGAIRAGERPKVAFLFTGQGAQYAGMGRGLYEREPVFRAIIDRAQTVLADRLERPLTEVLFGSDDTILRQTAYTQPALFALEYALAEQWRAWGVTPAALLGHSVGEYAAACVAGVFDFESGLELIAARGRAMQDLPEGGAMAALFATADRVAVEVAPYADRLSVAGFNGPEETVIAGTAEAVEAVIAAMTAQGVEGRRLDVSHAFHSPLLDPMLGAFEARAAGLTFAPPKIPLISNLTGRAFGQGEAPDAGYWRRHAREPVRFAQGIDALRQAGITALVEIGPHPTLIALASRAAPDAAWAALPSLRRNRDDERQMLQSLGGLYVRGQAVNWSAFAEGEPRRRAPLPVYPFQRERAWLDALPAPQPAPASGTGHPLLGEGRELAAVQGARIWESEVGLDSHPWLTDHRVQGAAIVPATAYIEMAFAAAGEALGSGPVRARNIQNLKPMILREGVRRRVQTSLTTGPQGASFQVHSRPVGGSGSWIAHVTAEIGLADQGDARAAGLAEARRLSTRAEARHMDRAAFYNATAALGNEWGPDFQGLDEVWRQEGQAFARIALPTGLAGKTGAYRFHPALSDSCGHVLVAITSLSSVSGQDGAFVGGGVDEVRFYQSPSSDVLWAYARLRDPDPNDPHVVVGDLEVYDESGALITETIGARLWYLDEPARAELLGGPSEAYFKVDWRAAPRGEPSSRAPAEGPWLVFADAGGVGQALSDFCEAAGRPCLLVRPGAERLIGEKEAVIRPGEAADYTTLLEAAGPFAAVIDLWSLDDGDEPGGAVRNCERLVRLLRALRARSKGGSTRVWLGTSGAQDASADDRTPQPFGAALWGLGKAFSVEHAELWGGLIDLQPGAPVEAAAQFLAEEVLSPDREDKLAWRGGRRLAPRLVRRPATSEDRPPFEARADRAYLVTGGLGGVGLTIARWLAEHGARHLVLIGRTGLPDRSRWTALDNASPEGRRVALVAEIEALGATVEVEALDVAAAGALEGLLNRRSADGAPEVAGVIHAAGVLQFEPLSTQSIEDLHAVMKAKVDGAWRLHEAFLAAPLDLFVMCSSTSALLNSPLLGAYAAGNSVLDALAHYRRAAGLAALSVNWGTWGEVGMAVEAGRSASGDMLTGVGVLSNAAGLAALADLLRDGDVQAAVTPIDWVAFGRAYPAFAADPFLVEQVGVVAGGATAEPRQQGLSADRLQAAEDQGAVLGAYLRDEAARVLGIAPERLDPNESLALFGLDSLMAVQIKNRIESDLGVAVPMIQFLQGPSLDELTPVILEVFQSRDVSAAAPQQDDEEWEEGSL